MRILKAVGFTLVGLFVVVTLLALVLPRTWTVQRETVVSAPPEAILPLIASFKDGWTQWSPFGTAEDPSMKLSFTGPDSGAGATESWVSDRMPPGSMHIVDTSDHGVTYELALGDDVIKGTITLDQQSSTSTRVVWRDDGDVGGNPYRHYFAMLLPVMMGDGFDKGLLALKHKAEAHPR